MSSGDICLVGSTGTPEEHLLASHLQRSGFALYTVRSIAAAAGRSRLSPLAAVILPCHAGGVEENPCGAVRHLRAEDFDGVILVLGAHWEPSIVVEVLNSGADEYVRCPYDPAEVVARLRALTARAKSITWIDPTSDLFIDPIRQVLGRAGQEVALTAKETAVITALARTTGRVVPLSVIIERAWGHQANAGANKNLVEVYVSHLRRKLLRIKSPLQVCAVRGIGYRLSNVRVIKKDESESAS